MLGIRVKIQEIITDERIMLEQIVGRGLRGARFGGTERCLVVTPQDRLVLERRLGGGMAFVFSAGEGFVFIKIRRADVL